MPKHTTPERVTDILREFLDSGQNMTEFAKNKDLGRSTFFEWVKGAAVPGGRQGLTEEERGRLDEQKNRNNGTDPQKVTEVLREFLDSGQNVTEFAKNKKMERNTLANWVKGIKVPGGRQGLTDEERGKLDERAQEKEIDRKAPYVTEILREFLGSDRTMTEFAKNKNMERSTLANWVKGVAIAGGRAGLTPEEQERLDERSQEKTSRTNPQGITDTLREFLRSGQTMPIFTRNKNINRTTFYSWAKGTKVPDGRAGLTLDEQVKLDERLQNKTDPQAVTEVLREFLGSNKSMGEFAKSKKITPNTFYTWAKGVAGGRAGLTPEEQVKLDERRQ
ncbi:hypothetical protein ACWD5R_45185, partial [Streptomyces sp. NPDC002514]|uniref:hypothetical protein n=1 Tax=Streptomyces sp. NPDC001270 TaxID=3364554 RepID=UPI0036CB4FB6